MASSVCVVRPATRDTVYISVLEGCPAISISFRYIVKRFDLSEEDRPAIAEAESKSPVFPVNDVEGEPVWTLLNGSKYLLVVGNEGESFADVPTSVDPYSCLSNKTTAVGSPDRSSVPAKSKDEVLFCSTTRLNDWKVYPRSAYDILLNIKGSSELSRFVRNHDFESRQVDCLPNDYDGNIVFELPPSEGEGLRGLGLKDMDREKDCYSWGQLMPTSARLYPNDIFQVQKVLCQGSWECQSPQCDHFVRTGERNCTSWLGRPKSDKPCRPGEESVEGVECGFCKSSPVCISSCSAKMFYVYPLHSLSLEKRKNVSRLAVHMGRHNHPPRTTLSRVSVKRAKDALRRSVSTNPSSTPSRIRNVATGELLKLFNSDVSKHLLDQEVMEIWDSLKVLSTPQKFSSLLRSIRRDEPKRFELGSLRELQKNVRFPFIHRYLLPGQASAEERCHIFKMSTKGPGSGVDLLRQMSPGNPLEGTWVSFDVMHRMTSDWLTFSAHVYDHNYRALCTIFTCELRSEDALSLEKAWRLMVEVAVKNGVSKVHIYGFMADNAQAGWTSVRNVFFGGEPNPERERSDAFHLYQSLVKHSALGIPTEKQGQHRGLFESLRNAPTYLDAYRISQEIQDWWKSGNCLPGKLRMLQGWLAWWIVRWRQWGNYIRNSLSGLEAGLMPNTTGSESIHSAMRKCSSERKIGLIEACETDQNRAAGQIAAYASYLEGQHRGRGPTVFELAFRSAIMTGSESACIEASNALLNASSKYDLFRTLPLHGDLRTKSVKRKGSATGVVGLDDSHRPDTILLTTPVQFKGKRRNLSQDFTSKAPASGFTPVDPGVEGHEAFINISDNETSDDVEILITPPRRSSVGTPGTEGTPPSSSQVREIIVPFHTWHLRRTTSAGVGPECKGRLRSSSAHRDECRDRIKKTGLKEKRGVVGIAFHGTREHQGVSYRQLFWFCPNNVCHRSGGRRNMSSVPPVPDFLPVNIGTNLSDEEISFLLQKGIQISGVPVAPTEPIGRPSLLDIRINVDSFVEIIPQNDSFFRSPTREGRKVRIRVTQAGGHKTRIRAAEKLHMTILGDFILEHGNAFGKTFCLNSGESGINYWVQICSFPCCSCEDFYKRHTFRKPYMPCKHLYWVYKNIGGLDLHSSPLVDQPVLTREEVLTITSRP